jgi:YVTN family beta-propeller protein
MFVQPGAAPAGNKKAKKQPASALFVANTNSDTISVINTKNDKVVQTIATDPWPSSDTGYAPTSIAMADKNHLLVTLGRANAVAVYQYNGKPQQPVDYIGLTAGARTTSSRQRAETPRRWRSRRASVIPRRSSTCSCWSRRTAPTTRSTAT